MPPRAALLRGGARLTRYAPAGEYVTCQMCRSLNTRLERDSDNRLYFMTCLNCNSRRSVIPIKSGFHAVGRGERRRARRK